MGRVITGQSSWSLGGQLSLLLAVLAALVPRPGTAQESVSLIAERSDSGVWLRWTLPEAQFPDGEFTVVRSGGPGGEARFSVPSPMSRSEAVGGGLLSDDEYGEYVEIFAPGDTLNARERQARDLSRAMLVLTSLSRLEWARVLGTVFEDTSAAAATEYTYTVTGTFDGDVVTIGEVAVDAGTADPLPSIEGFNAEAHPGGIDLRWDLPGEGFIVSYRLFRIDPAGAESEVAEGGVFVTRRTDPTTGESRLPDVFYRDTAVVANTTYTYAVAGMNAFGRLTARSEVEIFFPDPVPLAVPVISAADTRDGEIELFWAMPEDSRVTGIGVLRSLDPSEEGTLLTPEFLSPAAVSYVDEGVAGGIRYYYSLVTVDAYGGRFGPGPPWSARGINLTPPSAPTDLRLTPTEESLELAWEGAPEVDVRGYQVFLVRENGDTDAAGNRRVLVTDSLVTSTSYILPVPPGTLDELAIVVRAVNTSNVEGPFSEPVRGRILDTVPPAPPILGRIRGGEGVVELTWVFTEDPDVAAYRVSRTVQGEDDFSVVARGLAPDQTVWIDSMVTPGLLHAYSVVAVDASGNVSEPSAPLAATPYRFSRPDAPARLVARLLEDGGVILSWEAPATPGILTYIVERTVGEGRYVQIGDPILAATREYTDASGRAGHSYRVLAVDTSGNTSEPSAEVTVEER